MSHLERCSPPEERKGSVTLGVRDPLVESLLCGLGIDAADVDEIRQFCKVWTQDRNRYDIAKRQGGLFSAGRLRKEDADVALKRALSRIGGDA